MYYYGDWADYRQMYQMPSGYGGYPRMDPAQFGGTPWSPGPGGPAPWGGGQPGTPQLLAQQVLSQVQPLVQYAGYEQQVEGASLPHAIMEVAAIAYLMGRGLPFEQARRLVESWEVNEKFPGYERT